MARQRGFTLLEVVLAMASLALVSSICYSAFYLGIRSVEKGERAVVTAQRLRVASDILIRQVKSAVPYPARNADGDVFPYFIGTARSVSFVTAAGQLNGGGMARIVYHLEDGPRLILEESSKFSPDSLGTDAIDASGERSAVVIEGFDSAEFQYLPPDDFDEGHNSWTSIWGNAKDAEFEDVLPRAIRITLKGLRGLDTDTWVQEIPIMATNYGDNAGEADEDDIGQPETDPDLGDPNALNPPNTQTPPGPNDDKDDPDDPDDGPNDD